MLLVLVVGHKAAGFFDFLALLEMLNHLVGELLFLFDRRRALRPELLVVEVGVLPHLDSGIHGPVHNLLVMPELAGVWNAPRDAVAYDKRVHSRGHEPSRLAIALRTRLR